jgi:fucose 4-O-acetylase-like acetyltransferase
METVAAPLPGAGAAAPAVKKRWWRADNIRYILLFNVIAEHMLTQTDITYNWLVTVLVCWSRMITMPGFCFVSGYFSKKGDKCYQSAVFDFLMPYLIFNTLFVLIFGSSAPNIFTPTFAYWYLMCMFFWKLLTKALQQIKYIIPISFVVALLVGGLSDVGHFLSLSRTIGFLPFYLIGMKMSREDVAKLENLPKVAVFVVTMVVMALWGWLNVKGVYHIDLYYYWEPYAGIADDPLSLSHMGLWQGMLFRALGYVVSGVLIVFLFCIIPDKSLPIMRDGGTRTMVPYLLHTYFIMNMKYLYQFVPALDRWYFTVPIALVMAVFLMWLLGLPALDELYKDLMGFVKKILYKDPQKA